MIGNVKKNPAADQLYNTQERQSSCKKEAAQGGEEESGVILELRKEPERYATYGKPTPKQSDIDEVNRLWEETNRATANLRGIVESLISRQGKKLQDILNGKEVLLVDSTARAEAEAAISENGEWGVKAVSGRIVAFAKAISGGDKSKLAELRSAIDEGFKAAEKAFGGQLPDICRKTYDEVMKQLDNWEKEE